VTLFGLEAPGKRALTLPESEQLNFSGAQVARHSSAPSAQSRDPSQRLYAFRTVAPWSQ